MRLPLPAATALALAVILGLATCADEAMEEPLAPQVKPAPAKPAPSGVVRVTVAPATASLQSGQTAQLTALALDRRNK
jgi:hypothetical protein